MTVEKETHTHTTTIHLCHEQLF